MKRTKKIKVPLICIILIILLAGSLFALGNNVISPFAKQEGEEIKALQTERSRFGFNIRQLRG